MTDQAYVQVPSDGTGKKLRMASVLLDDGTTAYQQIVVAADEHGRLVAFDQNEELLTGILEELRLIREILAN